MGQKVNPHLFRLGHVYNWDSRWFENKNNFKEKVYEDYKLRIFLMDRLKHAGVAKIEIERSINSLRIIAFVSRPGIVIGRAGTGLDDLKKALQTFLRKQVKTAPKLDIKVEQVKEPHLDAYLVARNISEQLIKRLPYKRIISQTGERVMGAGARGVRIVLSGRIAGSEIGRREKLQRGTVPLSTIRESIQFASVPALTKKGYIGVKVWINKPEGK